MTIVTHDRCRVEGLTGLLCGVNMRRRRGQVSRGSAEVGQFSSLQDHCFQYYTYRLYFTLSTVPSGASGDGKSAPGEHAARHLGNISTLLVEEVDYLSDRQA